MYRHEEMLTMPLYTSAAWRFYTHGMTIGFLDLETTGLSHRRDHIVLGGLLTAASHEDPDHTEASLIQLLCDHPDEEKEMLTKFWEDLSRCQVIVTYNGESFDLPFLKKKLLHYGIVREEQWPLFLSVDLYRVFQNNCPMASLLPDLKQKTVEDAFGLTEFRKDQIHGAESIKLYDRYAEANLSAGQPEGDCHGELRDLILLHNSDDICQLTRLMKLLDKVDFHSYMIRKGFLVTCGSYEFRISQISLTHKELSFEATSQGLLRDLDVFHTNYRITHNSPSKRLTVQISLMYLQECTIADLEALPGDYSPLMRYPGYESGYLILRQDRDLDRAATNHLIQRFLQEVFHENQL